MYVCLGGRKLQLTRILKPELILTVCQGCWKDAAKHQLSLLRRKKSKQLTYKVNGQLWTCKVFSCKTVLSERKAYLGSIFEPKGTRADVSENAGTANARLTSAFARPRLRIRPCPYFIPKHTYHLERSEWKRVSKCFKPCTCIVSQNSLGSSSAYLKSPTAMLWVSALLKAICIFSFHQIGLWLAGAVSGLLQTPVLARVCWQSVKN